MTGAPPTPASWQRLQELFDRALALPRHARDAYAANACSGDPALHRRLSRLLAAHHAMSAGTEPGDMGDMGDMGDADNARDDGASDAAEGGAVDGRISTAGGAVGGFLESVDALRASALLVGAAAEPEPGSLVGRYRVVRQLGHGGMGVVYLAHDPVLGRDVALKLLPAWAAADAAGDRRLLEEARAASTLDHPHIATIHEVGRTADGRLYMAMAYCPGETLRQRLDRRPEDVAGVAELGAQLADALAAAHEAGIVHRDIKPENIIIGPDGRARILDFGISRGAPEPGPARGGTTARAAAAADSSVPVRGTVSYMSPEQARGDDTDRRTDIWSLGVTLYEALAGRRPFNGESAADVLRAIREDDPAPLRSLRPDVPAPLAIAVHRCLHRDPGRRFPSARDLRDALRGTATRSRRRLAAAAAVAILAVGAVGFMSVSGPPRIAESRGLTGNVLDGPGLIVVTDGVAAAEGGDAGSNGTADIAAAVREALAVDLQQSDHVTVLSRAQVAGVLRRMDAEPSSALDVRLAREVALRAGADAVLDMSVARVGPRYLLTGRAIDPADGAELFAVRTDVPERRLLAGVEVLSRDMRRRLGEARAGLGSSRPLPEVSTPSLYALQRYAEAERLAARSEFATALSALEDALRHDPEFAMAHRLAGAVASSLLRFGDASLHLSRAYEHRHRLTDRERWHVEAFHHATVSLDPHRAEQAYALLLERYPADSRAANNQGVMRSDWLADPDGGLRSFLRASQLDPYSTLSLTNAIHTAFLAGRTTLADSLAAVATARGLGGIETRWQLRRDFAAANPASWMPLCDELLRDGRNADDLEFCGSADIAAGRLDRGSERLRQAAALHMSAGRARNAVHAWQGMAVAHLLRGDGAAAAQVIEDVMRRVPAAEIPEPDRFITRTNLQVQAALMRRPDLVERIGATYPPFAEPGHWFSRAGEGLVAAAEAAVAGHGQEALRLLEATWPMDREAMGWRVWHGLIGGMAFDLTGEPDAAAASYRRAADPRYLAMPALTKNRLYLPLVQRRLAALRPDADNGAPAPDR